MHAARPLLGANLPSGQLVQAPMEVAPCALLYFPDVQGVQVFVPKALQDPSAQHVPALRLLKVSAAQDVQAVAWGAPLPS